MYQKTLNLLIILAALLLPAWSLAATAELDLDGDGLTDEAEVSIYHTDPQNTDSDGDGHADGSEVSTGYSPRHGDKKKLRQMDTDGDGLWDDWEIALGTNIEEPDTDGDGFKDGLEVARAYNPLLSGGSKIKKTIKVDLSEQKLAYYFGPTKLDEFLISSGKKSTPTPVGAYSVLKKRPTVHYAGPTYDYPNTKWNLMFKPGNGLNYYIHGAWWHNDFGKTRSAGCVNVPHVQEYMGRLYDWADIGTPVSVQT